MKNESFSAENVCKSLNLMIPKVPQSSELFSYLYFRGGERRRARKGREEEKRIRRRRGGILVMGREREKNRPE